MTRVLFAWELGSNLGHLARDFPIASACLDAGHEVVMAVSNLRTAADLFRGEGFTLVQAPHLRPSAPRASAFRPISYADMLLHQGYDDCLALAGALAGWQSLFDLINPALLVFNHAPTALVAARARGLPVMLLGTGFEIPPARHPLPSFRPWQDIPPEALQRADDLSLVHVNAYLQHHGHTPLPHLAHLFSDSATCFTSFAELDPFGPRSDARYMGPVHALPYAPVVQWNREASSHRIFAYLRPSVSGCENLLAALQALDAEVICALPGMPEEWPARYPALRLLAHPVDLSTLLPQADLTITYGAGTVAPALLAGVPVLMIPQVIEQYLTGIALQRTGAGRVLGGTPQSMENYTALLIEMLQAPQYRQHAQNFSNRYAGFDMNAAVESMLKAHGLAW